MPIHLMYKNKQQRRINKSSGNNLDTPDNANVVFLSQAGYLSVKYQLQRISVRIFVVFLGNDVKFENLYFFNGLAHKGQPPPFLAEFFFSQILPYFNCLSRPLCSGDTLSSSQILEIILMIRPNKITSSELSYLEDDHFCLRSSSTSTSKSRETNISCVTSLLNDLHTEEDSLPLLINYVEDRILKYQWDIIFKLHI